ncbi:MAG: oligosaccharide flippase family protein, partial [Nitrosomonadales bacterium]|nr:oligosaccharide flippase family protein [Nitrosomonadales bacterium]
MSTIHTKSLKSRAIRAGFWTIFGHGSGQFIRLATNLVMTRLLVPEMFGVMAIVTVIMIGLVMFSDLGLRQNIIQSKRGDDPVFLDTAWTVQAIIGIGLWLLSVVVALLFYAAGQSGIIAAGTVYSHPILPWVIPVSVLAVLIKSFEPTWTATASRRLDQSKITMIEIASQLFSVLVMVVWAMFDRSIWALVAGGVSASLARSFIVWILIPGPRNHWRIDPASMHEIFHFGKWLFWSSILTFLFFN